MLPKSVQKLIQELSKMPGIGMKTASRLTFYLLSKKDEEVEKLGEAVLNLKEGLRRCKNCYNLSEGELCPICEDSKRDKTKICVVENPLDVVAIEKGGEYNGLYHILGGTISPVDGIGPEQLRIKELLDRLSENTTIKEVILATNPDLEGDATSIYIQKKLKKLDRNNLEISRIATGLPMGGDIEYADEVTIKQALEGRKKMGEE